jgi:ribosomal peptide maturation radical SAM protein 1
MGAETRIEGEGTGGVDVCLVVPPFASMHFPSLGTAVLKTACEARGLSVAIVYGAVELAALAGLDAYDAVAEGTMRQLVGERLFRAHAYPPETLARMIEPDPLPEGLQAEFEAVQPHVAKALDIIVAQVLALKPRIVGVSTTFQQNLACAAVARRVKQAVPETVTVMGGANSAWPLALGLAKAFPWIDHFFAGESDIDFPDFCEKLVRDGARPETRVIRSEPIRDMRRVSEPDFTDFFAALAPHQASGALPSWLPRYLTMETSRGCWWGAKNHCTFCGLNGEGMEFRDKPADKARDALLSLANKTGVEYIHLTDNIMPRQYVNELMPELARAEPRVKLYYEVKANLSEAQIDSMAEGGVIVIQPGIESLSSDVLRLMRKGVSAHQNIALLRHCRGVSMKVDWGIIYGFPGELAADYEAMIALMPRIAHLQPPNAAHRIVIDRFSPYYKEPERLGIGTLSPFKAYHALYPPEAPAAEVAYHFDGSYTTELLGDADLIVRLNAGVAAWRAAWDRKVPALELFDVGGKPVVLDTRPIARAPMTPLTREQHEALTLLGKPLSREGMDPALAEHADWLVARGFAIDYEGKVMSLVVRSRAAGKVAWKNWQDVSVPRVAAAE